MPRCASFILVLRPLHAVSKRCVEDSEPPGLAELPVFAIHRAPPHGGRVNSESMHGRRTTCEGKSRRAHLVEPLRL